MTWLHPWALAGLVAAGLPLLLHLLARRDPPTVLFPAVRYLLAATERQQRRLRLQHWLLLLLRTLLIACLVLAAAGPALPLRGAGTHPPTALALVVDNSLSSGAVADGTPVIAQLRRAARAVLGRATPGDRLWLVTADLVPRSGDAARLAAVVDSLAPTGSRLDLGAAVLAADRLLATAGLPGEIVVVTDLQASAVGAARPKAALTVLRPEGAPPRNLGVARVDVGAQPWPPEGGRVAVALAGDSAAVQVTAAAGDRPPRRALGSPALPASFAVAGLPAGWVALTAAIDPDELRADDSRPAVVRVAPVADVAWDPAGRYLAAAADVLERNGRLRRGTTVALDRLGSGPSVVFPPAEAGAVGALNRALERRGVAWRFGDPAAAGRTDSGEVVGPVAVRRRLALVPAGGAGRGVVATVGGEPWVVRSGNVVLLGSRLDPAWTDLPLSADFLPFLDRLLNRVAQGEVAMLAGAPGEPAMLPDAVTEVRGAGRRWTVEGGAAFRPPANGVYYLLAGTDTIGALAAGPDPRESQLARLPDDRVRAAWPGARVDRLEAAGPLAFAGAGLADLRGPLLWLALLCAAGEVALASVAWRPQEGRTA